MLSKLFNLLLLVALVICIYFLANLSKGTPVSLPLAKASAESSRIEVSAFELKKFVADKFITGFRLELRGKDKDRLFKQMSDRRNVIFGNVAALDIPQSNVEQNSVDFRKEWSYDKGRRELVGYVATQFFSVTVDRKSDAAALLASLSSEDDIEIMRTSAMLKDEDAVQASVIKAAGKKAMDKANHYAESVGTKAGKVLFIGADGGGVTYGESFGLRRAKGLQMVNSAMMDGAAPMESTIADSVEVSASIRLVVELE